MTKALLSGQYGTDKDAVMVKSGGKTYSVPTANLGKFAAGAPDLHVMSDEEIAAHEQEKQQAALQAQYGGLGSQAIVGAAGAASGATLGLSDVALGAVLSKEHKEDLAKMREANPYTNLGSQVAGAIAPTLLSGGAAAPEEAGALGLEGAGTLARTAEEASTLERAGGAAKAAFTAPTRALDTASNLAERGTEALVGSDARTFAGQVAQRAITKAAGGAVTGGVSTGMMEVGEDAVSPDHQLTGEQLLHDMGVGALLGAGLGTAGGVVGAALERAAAPGEEGASPIRDMLRKMANDWEVDATGAKTKEVNRIEKAGVSKDTVGQWMHDNLSSFTEDGSHPITRDAKLEAAQAATEDAAPKIAAHIDTLDQVGAKPDWAPIVDRLKSEVVDPLEKSVDPGVQNVGKQIRALVENAETKLGDSPTFRQVYDLRREVDEAINFSKADVSQATVNSEKRNVRAVLEDEIGKQGRAALGEEWGNGYDAAKRQYRMGTIVSQALESADKRIGVHEPISLTSTILGAHGLGAFAAGHPMGLLAGGAAMVGNHLLKTYGKAVGARLLHAMLDSGAVENTIMPMVAARAAITAQRNYTSAVTRGITAITHGAVASNAPGRPKSLDGSFADKSKAVQAVMSNPQYGQEVQAHAAALGPSFATVGSSYQRAAVSSMFYLSQQMPKERPIDPASPKAGTIKPSDADKARFVRVFNAVDDPTTLLHAASKGALTRDMVDAVAFTKPATMRDLQARVTAQLKELKTPLAPPQAAAVKMILGEPVFDRPIAPLTQPQVTAAANGTPHHHGQKVMKGNLSASTALHGSGLGS